MAPSVASSANVENSRIMYATRDFIGNSDSQNNVHRGDSVELLSNRDRYWWLVRDPRTGRTGYIPFDVLETQSEWQAKIDNKLKNTECTLANGPSDTTMPWRAAIPYDSQEQSKQPSWMNSGFAVRAKNLRSAPIATRHRKTVSFSEAKPSEHNLSAGTMSSSSGSSQEELCNQMSRLGSGTITEQTMDGPLFSPSEYDQQILDPAIERLLEKEFGVPVEDSKLRHDSCNYYGSVNDDDIFLTPKPEMEANTTELNDRKGFFNLKTPIIPKVLPTPNLKARRLASFIKKFWKGRAAESPRSNQDSQLFRVYSGNFTATFGYKTLQVEERASLEDMLEIAKDKFGLSQDGFKYSLCLVHVDTCEQLPLSKAHDLANIIELAKMATIIEETHAPETKKSLAKLPRSIKRRYETTKKSMSYAATPKSQAIRSSSFSCLASPVVHLASSGNLQRDKRSDFVTHFKFVLNRMLSSSSITPFYMKALMLNGTIQRALLGGITTPNSPILTTGVGSSKSQSNMKNNELNNDEFKNGEVTKVQVNTSMTVSDLLKTVLASFNITQRKPDIKYELFLTRKPSDLHGRIYLSKDLTVLDVLSLKPAIDPSSLILLVQKIYCPNNVD